MRWLPFEDSCADTILSVHVIEHIYVHDLIDTLREWLRVLKRGGQCIIECPDLMKCIKHIMAGAEPALGWWGLYGAPNTHRGEADLHKWAYVPSTLGPLMLRAGFSEVREEPARYKRGSVRDMRLVAIK